MQLCYLFNPTKPNKLTVADIGLTANYNMTDALDGVTEIEYRPT